jgi:predicted nuclease with TOPRIM domain
MSENQDLNDVEALKARIQELEVELAAKDEQISKLKDTLAKAGDALQGEINKQKNVLVSEILALTDIDKEELEKLDLKQLRLIHKALSNVKTQGEKDKTTVKTVRSAATSGKENTLTVGNLYHKPQEEE